MVADSMPESQSKQRLEAIVRSEGQRIYALAYRLSGNEVDARDVVQEVFMKVYQSLDQFEGRSQLSTYLYRVTFNAWCNLLRQRKKNRWVSLEENQPETLVTSQSDPVDAREFLERQERIDLVRSCLEKLPAREKFIVVLRDIEEHSYEEIAAILRCRPGTVKSRLARARQHLRQLLQPYLR